MKIIKLILLITILFSEANVFARGVVYPHEIMFLNCTHQTIYVTNGDKSPYKFSMDPLVDARNGYSPPYSFVIPPQFIYKHPMTIYINNYTDGAMHMYLSGAINSEIYVTMEDSTYIKFKSDPRYVELIGYNDNWTPGRGNRSILGLGCEKEAAILNGSAPIKMQDFKVKFMKE